MAELNSLLQLAGHSAIFEWADAGTGFAYVVLFSAASYLIITRRLPLGGSVVAWFVALVGLFGTVGEAMLALDLDKGFPWLKSAVAMLPKVSLFIAALITGPAVAWMSRRPSQRQLQREIDEKLRTLEELRDVCAVLEQQVTARTAQLTETTQRFESVLRQSPVSVFSQDKFMRYTWVRNPPPAFPPDVINKTDEEVLPEGSSAQISGVKRRVLQDGDALTTEISLEAGGERRWYDMTVEPVRAVDGSIVGTTSVAVDISHRKRNEELLQLLLKEVTHRSKNLLAVVHGIVRHGSPRAAATEGFADRLGARLRALAVTHDLLVAADWRGVKLPELVIAQIGVSAEHLRSQIIMDGGDIVVTPNAADSLGLMLHELIENAKEYGALSTPAGQVEVTWQIVDGGNGDRLSLCWEERGGPPVRQPTEFGFGRRLLEKAIGTTLTAEVKLDFPTEGVRCEITLPSYHVVHLSGGFNSFERRI